VPRTMLSTGLSCPNPGLHPGYRLHHFLGRGGFGEVWEAETTAGEPVALKFMRCADNQAAVHEVRSIQMVRALSHPNLLRIDRVWSSPGYLVIAMELADASLADLLEAYREKLGKPVPPADLLPLLEQAAEALDFLNARQHLHLEQRVGIQHCDVTPSNLLLCGDTLKLTDFGLTSPLLGVDKTHRSAGTPDYMAPEVLRGRLSDRTDQYALAVCYCLLRGGRLPFPEVPVPLARTYVRPPPDLRRRDPAERPVVGRALSVLPGDRWPCCRAFLAALREGAPGVLPGSRSGRASERRAHRRDPPAPDTACEVLAWPGKGSYPAQVLNLSAGGARLLLPMPHEPLKPGNLLSLTLSNKARGFGRVFRLRVVYGKKRASGQHEVGVTFQTALRQEELTALLASRTA
jgi:serine/threonine-protein kinase